MPFHVSGLQALGFRLLALSLEPWALLMNHFAVHDLARRLEVGNLKSPDSFDGQHQNLIGTTTRLGFSQSLSCGAKGAQHLGAIKTLTVVIKQKEITIQRRLLMTSM